VATRATFRADLRRDLRDEDAAAYIWTDAVLNRHIAHAIDRVQTVAPRLASLAHVTVAAGRSIALTGLLPATYLWLEAIDVPIAPDVPCRRAFRLEPGPTAVVLDGDPLGVGTAIVVWYAARYTVDDSSSDLPAYLEAVVLDGALAFAGRDQAIDVIARLNPSGDAPAQYRAIGDLAERRFEAAIDRLRLGSGVGWRPVWADV
jgi:hypothetical protein